ncbi:PQ-loop repeat-containing protein [Candidatus Gottesmanbacteria bacterium]|nr:PQ-loop repeat-containing protein [Candidatus Gottesmanbacteria bacterium]
MSNLSLAAIIGVATVVVGILVKLIGFPDQFLKNYRRRSTEGLSTIFFFLAFLSYILWTLHGYLEKDWVLIIGQGAGVITTGAIVYQIIIYKNKNK